MPRRRTKWKYVERDEDGPLYEGCIRVNPAAQAMWPNWPYKHNEYQTFRKCLYTRNGVCRRCGVSREQIEKLKDQGRPWEKPLVLTPLK